ncbi:hypothetical protein GCM10009616_39920 [Microlunatus lacustris]
MSVAVAHQPSATGHHLTLQEGAKEASLRKTSLSVIQVAEGVDVDLLEDQRTRQRREIAKILDDARLAHLEWDLHLTTGVEVAETVLDHVEQNDVELLVIGARRRSAVGKLIMGSVTQSILLRAAVPVLVVKPPARS